MFYKSHIYPVDSIEGRPQAHASTLTQIADKDNNIRIKTAWFCGTKEGAKDVAILSSTISYPRKIYTSGEPAPVIYSKPEVIADHPDKALGNPVLFRMTDGVLHFWYAVLSNEHGKPEQIMHKRSLDDGKTWTEPEEFAPREGIWPRNLPIVLHSGRILLPLNDELTYNEKYKTDWSSGFAYSDDDGKTWHHTDYIFAKKGCIQPAIAQRSDGSIYCVMRGRKGHLWESVSTDDGETWKEPEKVKIQNPNSNAALIKSGLNEFLLINNPSKKNRKFLRIYRSPDEGKTWKPWIDLEPSQFHDKPPKKYKEFSYPCIIGTNDSVLHITYTYGRKTIEHAAFGPGFSEI